MNKQRLLRLAEFLENEVPKNKFNMESWFAGGHEDVMHTCGTTACAFGWATAIPEFKKAGLIVKRFDAYNIAPSYRGYESFDAAKVFFDISYEVAHHFFSNDVTDEYGMSEEEEDEDGKCVTLSRHNETPQDVAARIRAYVANHD